MDLNQCELMSESDASYHVKMPSGKTLQVDKGKIHEKAHKIIQGLRDKVQKFDDGGTAQAQVDLPQETEQTPEQKVMSQVTPPVTPGNVEDQPSQPPSAVPQDSSPLAQRSANFSQGLEQQKAGIQQAADVASAEGAAESKAIKDNQAKIDAMPTQQDILDRYKMADANYEQQLRSQKLDPDRYLHSMSTGSRIAAGLGMLLGGAATGFGGKNIAADMIQKSIDNDIDAQKNDQSKTLNLWKMNREALGSDLAANLATQNQMYTGLKYKLEQAAAQYKGPMAQANAQQGMAMIQQKLDENHFKMSLMSPSKDVAPEQKVQFLVPPDRQKEVFEEIKNANNIANNGPKMTQAFDNAVKEVSLGGSMTTKGSGLPHLANAIPWYSPASVKAFHQLLLPNFKTIDGTVRQAAMDETFHNITPQTGDTDATIAKKRAAFQDWVKSESAAPTAKGFGIDLSQYPSTSFSGQAQQSGAEPQTVLRTVTNDQGQKVPALFDAKTKQFVSYK